MRRRHSYELVRLDARDFTVDVINCFCDSGAILTSSAHGHELEILNLMLKNSSMHYKSKHEQGVKLKLF